MGGRKQIHLRVQDPPSVEEHRPRTQYLQPRFEPSILCRSRVRLQFGELCSCAVFSAFLILDAPFRIGLLLTRLPNSPSSVGGVSHGIYTVRIRYHRSTYLACSYRVEDWTLGVEEQLRSSCCFCWSSLGVWYIQVCQCIRPSGAWFTCILHLPGGNTPIQFQPLLPALRSGQRCRAVSSRRDTAESIFM